MGVGMSGRGGPRRDRWRWWLVLCVLVAGLWAAGEVDPPWATDPVDEVKALADGDVGPVTTHHCPNRDRSDGTCRACPDFTETLRGGRCQPKIEPGPGDPPCPAGQLYYASYGGCRDVTCPRGPPHGNPARYSNGYCLPPLPPPPTTPPPPSLGAPRSVSVTVGPKSLTVSWQPPTSGASPTGWEIHYSYRAGTGPSAQTNSDLHPVTGRAVPSGGVTLDNLMPGVAYTIKVRAKKGTVNGPFSASVTVTTPVVTLVGLEVTQGLQDWEGSIKLVKGKKTVVRAFLEPFSGQDTTVSLRLEAVRKRGSTETVVATAYPVNFTNSDWAPTLDGVRVVEFTAKPDAADRRHELNASANFVLEDHRWVGTKAYSHDFDIIYRLVVPGKPILCREAVDPDSACKANLTFKPVKRPQVRIVGIKTLDGSVPDDPKLVEHARRIESLMPIPSLDYGLDTFQTTIDLPQGDSGALGKLLDELIYKRVEDQNSSVYLGVLDTPGRVGGLTKKIYANAAAWYTANGTEEEVMRDRRNTGSHEFGHVIGGVHAAYRDSAADEMRTICSAPTDPDAGEVDPYEYLFEVTTKEGITEEWAALGPLHPKPTDDTEVWGFDTRFIEDSPEYLAVINPQEVFSIMSFCYPNEKLNGVFSQGRWIDAYNHDQFIENINGINWNIGPDTSDNDDPVSEPRAVIRGYITTPAESAGAAGESASGATALPVLALSPGTRLKAPSGDYTLEFLDGDGNVLSSISFGTYTFASDDLGDRPSETEFWMVPVIEPSGWASYRILEPPVSGSGAGGAEGSSSSRTVLVEVTRSANAPVVSVTAPIAGQILSGDEVTFSWSGSDADGDDLSYTVQYSSDGGTSYEMIAVGYETTSLTVDRASLAGSATAKVKVTAADGTRTASAESPVFAVSQNRPEVFIHSPDANLISGSGALVLDATAYDTEDGLLDPSAVQWSSDSGGNLGTGGFVVVYPEDLEPGIHRLTATATDSTGATGSAEVLWVNPTPLVVSPPGAPAGVIATGGIRSITVSWVALAASLTADYHQYRYRPVSGTWTEWAGLPGVREHTITGLSGDTAYEIEVRTVTVNDISDPVLVTATTAASAPAAPTGLTAAGGDGWIDLSWDHPADSSITGYQFREKPTFDDDWWCWSSIWAASAETTSHRVSTLSSGTDYRIQVRARNAVGAGPAAQASTATAAAASAGTAPAAPAGLTGTGGDQSISLSWDNPGDSSIIEYQFREKTDSETGWRCWRHINKSTAATTSHTLPGITNNVRYRVQIRAINPTGAGPTSETSATPTAGP